MTTLITVQHNHMNLFYNCGHSEMLAVKELHKTLDPQTTIYQVADRTRCTRCGQKGYEDFRLHFVCKARADQ